MNTLPIALPLTPDACYDTSERCLSLEISGDRLTVLIPGADAGADYLYAEIALGGESSEYHRTVEETIYANPLLLCDYRRTSILLRDCATQIVPAGFGPWLPVPAGFDTLCENVPAAGAEVAGIYPSTLLNFLKRSFNNPHIGNHLTPLCSVFGRLSRRSNRPRVYIQYLGTGVDVLVYSAHALQFAASYPTQNADDALYYTLAACHTAGFSRSEGEMMLLAPADLRDSLQPQLRRYVNYVMPLIIPSDLCRRGPFELAVAARPNSDN